MATLGGALGGMGGDGGGGGKKPPPKSGNFKIILNHVNHLQSFNVNPENTVFNT